MLTVLLEIRPLLTALNVVVRLTSQRCIGATPARDIDHASLDMLPAEQRRLAAFEIAAWSLFTAVV